ncbi:metal ABC transporter permease [Brachybacterium sp. NBEC-018]|uniref:metal ABC transporter permease n=1 Tax=Brachybacterium sp. NBEC-018 TaxID=2996004 RepID=UPI0021750065|nr:metal ABC transporter permease [Brachybacterium sp. NBEC-018]UVY85052.1 metal ABC transporter permease [Brachybacterium sp. NBEC-018]
MTDVLHGIVDFSDYAELLPLLRTTIIACVALGLVGGAVGVFVMMRDMAFAVHGISELSFAGASAGLLLGVGVVPGSLLGSMLAALVIGVLGSRARERNSATAVLMPFGLGLGILCLSLYDGRASNKFGLLTGQIVAIDRTRIVSLLVICAVVLVGLAIVWRPLLFASTDPAVAAARGVPTRALSIVFMALLGAAVAVSVQVVGALLVLALLVTPAASALRLSTSPLRVTALSVLFALLASVGGVLLAAGSSVPISPFVTTISFAVYLVCRAVSAGRGAVAR